MSAKETKATKLMNDLLEEVVTSIKSAKSMIGEHAPDIAREIVKSEVIRFKYDLYKGILLILVAFIVLLGIVGVIVANYLAPHDNDSCIIVMSVIIGPIGICILYWGVSDTVNNISYLEQLKAAPKIAVLEYLRRITRG